MTLPNLDEVRYAVSDSIKTVENLIEKLSTQKSLTHQEFRHDYHSIMMELLQIEDETQLLTVNDKYSKGFYKMKKILLSLLDIDKIEKKHANDHFIFLDTQLTKDMRKDLIKFFKNISKQLKQVLKTLN
ncbi:MAG: hypothetical protein ABSB89_03990 [Candidatus Bathyarchaeia archaeon]|jgi:hypothetical protein